MRSEGPTAIARLAVAVLPLAGCALVAGLEDSHLVDGDAGQEAGPGTDSGVDGVAGADGGTDSAADAMIQDADAGPEGGSFTPDQLKGLTIWLEADQGVTLIGGKVAGWADQSGNMNHAGSGVTSRPVVDTAAFPNHPAIKFDGAATCLSIGDSPTLNWGLDDFTIEVVAKYTNTPSSNDVNGYGALYTKGSTTDPFRGPALFANSPANTPSSRILGQVKTYSDTPSVGFVESATVGFNDDKFRLLGVRRITTTSATLEARVNGNPNSVTIVSVNVDSVGATAWIGGNCSVALQYLNGEIAEIVAYHGTLPESDVQKVEAYLRTKYGL